MENTKRIYADHAATTRLCPEALAAMLPFLTEEYGNASQPYAFAISARRALREARATIAELCGALPEEIYFTSGGTEANNWAIKSIAYAAPAKASLLVSKIEHHSVLRAAEEARRMGTPVTLLSPTADGVITAAELAQKTNGARLVSIMRANNETGALQPIEELCEIAHKAGALFHTDAVQAVGRLPIRVKELGVDMLSSSAHKFNGPKGIGFLYVKKGTPLLPYMNGGSQEYGMRAGTENVAAIVGMATALRLACEKAEKVQKHLAHLEARLLAGIDTLGIPYLINGEAFRMHGILSLSFYAKDGEELLHELSHRGIFVSAGSACDASEDTPSHVLSAMGVEPVYARGTIRISLGEENTVEDVERIISALKEIFACYAVF